MSQSTLHRLRLELASLDPTLVRFSDRERLIELGVPIDEALGGGLPCGALHEIAPATAVHLAAASGFALALAACAQGSRGEVLWIATDFAMDESGGPYGPGLDLFGLASARLLVLRVPRPVDVLWAMEEGLRCRALACVVAELTCDGIEADLTATRRLALAAREGASARNSGFGLLIRHKATAMPSAAMTRWQVAAAPSRPDSLACRSGGLGQTRFDLSLRKNRRGPSGRWIIEWDHHECHFQQAVPVTVAAEAFDRSDRAAVAGAG